MPRFGYHTKCFDIFGKLRPSSLRNWLMTPYHPWAFQGNQDGVQDGSQKTKIDTVLYSFIYAVCLESEKLQYSICCQCLAISLVIYRHNQI